MELFKRFSSASGLHINSDKSDFYSNGMSPATIDKVLQGTGFKKGDLPFKMISRIRGWNSRKISYASRLVLVKSVISTIHNYWSQIFILLVGVMDRIQALCRNFLWEGNDQYSKAPLVAWNVLCQSKETGGLGLIDSKTWNVVSIGKLVWWITSKQDHLWIRWIDAIYLKGTTWLDYEPTPYSSWAWRKVCEVKNIMKSGYVNGKWRGANDTYTIAEGYAWLMQSTEVRVSWYKFVWNRFNTPKWCFTTWLQQQQRLLTLDRLAKMGVAVPTECYICGMAPETYDHLFRGCVYAQTCYQLLAKWLGVNAMDLCSCDKLLHMKKLSLLARQVIIAAVAGLIYGIWQCRNVCRLDGYVMQPGSLIQHIQTDCRNRVLGVFQGPMALADKSWCNVVGIC
ncbi:uncharacterized protein LOC141641401 [Silene latifolia]|uniref:uncharacterized protein LOC141641401 n=1 Tax=Silene latifolia TaxID=37657 RepID=UPI003D781341